MALIVEDGSGKADSESYISVADADLYFSNRANAAWAALATPDKEASLRKATDYMGQVYRSQWKGTRVTGTQALDWPRGFVERDDYEYQGLNGSVQIGGYFYFPSDEVPVEVARACAELALKASAADLSPDIGRRTIREKVDSIEVEYSPYGAQYVTYRAIDNLLSPFIGMGGSGAFRKVIRT
ncbi:MAG TPA: DnaT-like ssDNA-binding protein [Methylophilaceae bacterium]|nr:DnaT-like ssDNA-binding protein [Methylophilaceae bacterium]